MLKLFGAQNQDVRAIEKITELLDVIENLETRNKELEIENRCLTRTAKEKEKND